MLSGKKTFSGKFYGSNLLKKPQQEYLRPIVNQSFFGVCIQGRSFRV